MRDLDPAVIIRSPLIWGAPLAGLVVGAALWLVVGGPGGPARALEDLSGRGGPAGRGAPAAGAASGALTVLGGRPVFAETAATIPRIGVIGISRSPGRQAALVALGGAEPAWIQLGETSEGLTLVSVQSDGATFDGANGPIMVPLGETIDGAATAPGAPAPEGGPPPGVRLPPEPAAAPRP